MDKPLVSIITPCYNGEAFLDRYFNSVLSQTYTNLELIFINDGSNDRTEEIALSYREKLEARGIEFIYEYQENAGQAAALNRGLKLFKGDYIVWPDSDDVITPASIEEKVNFLLKNRDVQMVRSNGLFIDETTGDKRRISNERHSEKEDIFKDLLLLKTFGQSGCYMISKELFLKCYPERDIFVSRTGQNWQLTVPASSYSMCGYIDEDLYFIYERPQSHSRKKRSYEEWYARWDAFTEILVNAIHHSCCDNKIYIKLVNENCARQKFYYAVAEKNKTMMKKCINDIKKNGKVSLAEYILYLRKIML